MKTDSEPIEVPSRKFGDIVWVACSYTRPSKFTFLAKETLGQNIAVQSMSGSVQNVRSKDVFGSEREALTATLGRAKYNYKAAGWAVDSYQRCLDELIQVENNQ